MTRRHVQIFWRRHVAILRRLVRLPARCRAPLWVSRPPRSLRFAFWSFLSGTLGILAIAAVTELFGHPLLIGSFGASAVLLFGTPDSPLTQPRNLIGGHLISAVVALFALFGSSPLTMALAVGLAIFFMNLTHTTHPPGGATALIGVQGAASWSYIFVPVLTGAGGYPLHQQCRASPMLPATLVLRHNHWDNHLDRKPPGDMLQRK